MQGVRVDGAQPVVGEIENIDVVNGRYFTDAENEAAMRVAFIGADVADKLVPYGSAVGEEIYIRGIPYRVVGVQKAKGTVFGQPQDVFITLPLKTYASQFGALTRSRGLYFIIAPKSEQLFKDCVEEVRTLLRIKRKVPPAEKDNFGIVTPDAITGLKDRLFGTISVVVLTVPAISLIVGAIVIMNIMLVAVTERTKEIGIRKSLGARQADILRQFIFESATLAAIGGLIGLVLAFILSQIVSVFVFPTQISIFSAAIAIGVSGVIGILAGLFPAWRAARLDPIEALRAD
jgi:putative ABC transport system permease protein